MLPDVPVSRELLGSAVKMFLLTFAFQLLATVQASTNLADFSHYAWWKAALASALLAAASAAWRKLVPTAADKTPAVRSDLPGPKHLAGDGEGLT